MHNGGIATIISCENCGSSDWTLKIEEFNYPMGGYLISTMYFCNKCKMKYPVQTIVGPTMSSSGDRVQEIKEYLRYGEGKDKYMSLKKVPGLNFKNIYLLKKVGIKSLEELAIAKLENLREVVNAPEEEIREWVRYAQQQVK